MDLTGLDLWTVLRMIKTGEVSASAVNKICFDRAVETSHLNAFTYLNRDIVAESAAKVDYRLSQHKHTGILAGIPVAIKDNICTENMPTACGSNMLKGHIVKLDGTVVKKLKEQDAVIIGKTNMDEFAMGTTSDTSAFGRVQNPVNHDCTPGGSSSGSTVAVAVGAAYAGFGTDTGGSVRQPAAYCGVTGIKPTFGRVSRHGVFPLAPSLDHIGFCTKTVKDALLVFETVYGSDGYDKTCDRQENTNFDTHCLEYTNKRLRIGVLKHSFSPVVDGDIRIGCRNAADFFANEGYCVDEVDFQYADYVTPIYSILCCGGVVKSLSKLGGTKSKLDRRTITFEDALKATRGELFGLEAKRRQLYGQFVTRPENYAEYYDKARKIRTVIVEFFKELFQRYDVIMCPTTSTVAPKYDVGESPEQKDITDIFTITANLTGRPAISIPCGKDKNGMPMGLHFMGKTFNEHDIFNIAYYFEQNIGKDFIVSYDNLR